VSTERTRRKTALATRASGHHAVVQALGDEHIGLEARAHVDDHMDVKIWLRLLACSTQIEQQIRQRLRTRFNTTLPRFDYLAQLDRHPDGLRMNVLSRYLMVTGGNVTGLTDQLEKEGLVRREADPDDRRSFRVLLTDAGRRHFAMNLHSAAVAALPRVCARCCCACREGLTLSSGHASPPALAFNADDANIENITLLLLLHLDFVVRHPLWD
jgi:DNA-binding MarR family transcriptional regulator